MPLRTRNPRICETHFKHESYASAHREVCRLFETERIRVVVFPSNRKKPCKCGGWHVGHLRKELKVWELTQPAKERG